MYIFHPFLFLLLVVIFVGGVHTDNGTFWHISDIHVDQNYSRTGDTTHFCHSNASHTSDSDIGKYGNFLCDSPEILVNLTFDNMHSIQAKPDFIIWTGDNLPHVWNPNPGWNAIFEAINNLTDKFLSHFPNISIYPCIGNHDSFPPNILPAEFPNTSVYDEYLTKGGWSKIIPESSWSTFKKGGFYTTQIMPGLHIISLNTILWYKPNDLVANYKDPGGQFKWLETVLENITSHQEKAYIIGHVPPGYYVRVPKGTSLADSTYYPKFSEALIKIIEKHCYTIAGQFYGHLHMDIFQLFQIDSGALCSSSLLASSVTPWHSVDLGGVSLPVNPSVRLIHYDRNDGFLRDYEQYYLNLTKANEEKEGQNLGYQHLYTFTEAYNVTNATTTGLYAVYEKLKSVDKTFTLFNHYMAAGKDPVLCDAECKVAELCGMACIGKLQYDQCMHKSSPNTTVSPPPVTTIPAELAPTSHVALYGILATLIVILVLISSFAFYRIRKNSSRNVRQYERFPDF